MPLLRGTLTVILSVRDLEASSAWYAALLDAVEISRYREPGGPGQIVLHVPSTPIDLCLVQHGDGIDEPFDERRVGLDHLEFAVPSRASLDDWMRRLEDLGIPNSGIKSPTYTSNSMITFRDPDNIQLEFFFAAV